MQVDKDTAKNLKRRGEVNLIDKESSIRNAEIYKAIGYLRQARRCEQINHRLDRRKEAEPSMRAKYKEMNTAAIKSIKKELDLKDGDGRGLEAKLQQFTNKEMEEAMLGPTLKLQLRRFQKLHDTWKRKTVEKEDKVAQQLPSKERGNGT